MKPRGAMHKRQFSNLFLITVFVLMTLPFFVTSQDLITRILSITGISDMIQSYIIPIEVKLVIAMLQLLGIPAIGDGRLIVLQKGGLEVFRAQIIWSCIGWQSVVLLGYTLTTGVSGKHTLESRIEAIVIGLMGTFWVNIIRIVIIYLLGFYFGQLPAFIFHNFLGTLMVVAWLFFYWWLVYTFILEEKA